MGGQRKIELHVLGPPGLRGGDGSDVTTLLTQPKRFALLIYLAIARPRGFHRRQTLLALFWPESTEDRARSALRQTLHALRQRLGDDVIVNRGEEEVGVRAELLWCDAAEVDAALDGRRIADAVEMYRGELLPGFFLEDAPAFEDWLDAERRRLRQLVAEAALAASQAAPPSSPLGTAMLRRALELAPDDETIARGAMRALIGANDRAGALRVYEAIVAKLRKDLDVMPSDATVALGESLRSSPPVSADDESRSRLHQFGEAVDQSHTAVPAPPLAPPADRVNPVAEFGEALQGGTGAPGHRGTEPAAGLRAAAPPSRRVGRFAPLGLVAVVVVAGGLLVFRLGLEPREPAAPAAPAQPRTAIAVLPFENLSPEGPHSYFAGGLHEELLTQLSKVAALTLISRTSVVGYAGKSIPLRQIATELGVGSVVEGSVQVVGGRLRVNVQLIDAATDTHLWAERYDRTLDDAFAIQSDVAQRIVAAVGGALSGAERQGLAEAPTANAEAYRLYLQGREYFTRPGYGHQNWEIARQLYERAIALDPDFALAHAALSEVYGNMYWSGYDPVPGRTARQREEAEAALRLAPDLPQAHFAMGLAHYWGRRDYRRALAEFAIAQQGLPNDPELWGIIGYVHRRLGNWSEVLAAFDKATQLDPRDADLLVDLGGNTYRYLHRYAEAVQAYDRALSLAPDLHGVAARRGWAYVLWQGRLDTLRAVLSRLPRDAQLGGRGTTAAQQVQLLHWERNADSVLQVLMAARVGVFQGQLFFLPASLYAGWAHQLRGNRAAARAAFDAARVLLDSVMRELPDDWRVHAARGLALAGLGRGAEALGEARWLRQSVVYREDAYAGLDLAADHARILAQAGDVDGALDEIEQLLAEPSDLSVHILRLDPRWDPIREQPRFKALLARYAGR